MRQGDYLEKWDLKRVVVFIIIEKNKSEEKTKYIQRKMNKT